MRIILVFLTWIKFPVAYRAARLKREYGQAPPSFEGAAPQEPFFIGQVFMPSSR
jgi:hypothetical protein